MAMNQRMLLQIDDARWQEARYNLTVRFECNYDRKASAPISEPKGKKIKIKKL